MAKGHESSTKNTAATAVGAFVGYAIGGNVGLAAFGTAVSGAWPFAIAGGVIGLGVRKLLQLSRENRALNPGTRDHDD